LLGWVSGLRQFLCGPFLPADSARPLARTRCCTRAEFPPLIEAVGNPYRRLDDPKIDGRPDPLIVRDSLSSYLLFGEILILNPRPGLIL